jgi:tetratricopeptide (TPR) repeat protein
MWAVTFYDPWDLPVAEHDVWLDEELATDPDGRIPTAVQLGPKRRVRRASPKMLAFFEGFFLALAETTEDELDSGRWQKTVETSQGKLRLGLSLPDILSPPAPAAKVLRPFHPLRNAAMLEGIRDLLAGQDFESEEEMRAFLENEVVGRELPPQAITGPEDEARELAIEAMDTPGRRGVALARRALKLSPDSPTAHIALALRATDPHTAVDRFREAVAVAERALGPDPFAEDVGSFWLIPETRPYMEARKGLADALWLDGQREEAVRHYSELIRLNPNDNQSIRDRLAPALIALGDDEAAEDLLSRYEEDFTAAHHFNLALATFRRYGDGQASRERLADAVAANRHVPDLLLGRLEVPYPIPDTYTLGSADEAVLHFLEAEEAWDETPGALEWLAKRVDSSD